MKNILLFVAIITVCASLTKPSLGKCTPKIKMQAYMKGKLVKISLYDWSSEWFKSTPIKCWNKEGTHYVLADSIYYTITN